LLLSHRALQLDSLMRTLNSTKPHYVRCVKPNSTKAARAFEAQICLQQLRYAGVFEAITIRQLGFPFRWTHEVREPIVVGRKKRAALFLSRPKLTATPHNLTAPQAFFKRYRCIADDPELRKPIPRDCNWIASCKTLIADIVRRSVSQSVS
jgi:hypothetical protein